MAELSTAKQIVVLTLTLGCFAVLWPTIFYPMLQASVHDLKRSRDGVALPRSDQGVYASVLDRDRDVTDRLQQHRLSPRQVMQSEQRRSIPADRDAAKNGDFTLMNVLVPVYTAAVTIFLGYSLMKMLFAKTAARDASAGSTPIVCDFHMTTSQRPCAVTGGRHSVRPGVATLNSGNSGSSVGSSGARRPDLQTVRVTDSSRGTAVGDQSKNSVCSTLADFRCRLEDAEQTLRVLVAHLSQLTVQLDQLSYCDDRCCDERDSWSGSGSEADLTD